MTTLHKAGSKNEKLKYQPIIKLSIRIWNFITIFCRGEDVKDINVSSVVHRRVLIRKEKKKKFHASTQWLLFIKLCWRILFYILTIFYKGADIKDNYLNSVILRRARIRKEKALRQFLDFQIKKTTTEIVTSQD